MGVWSLQSFETGLGCVAGRVCLAGGVCVAVVLPAQLCGSMVFFITGKERVRTRAAPAAAAVWLVWLPVALSLYSSHHFPT